MVASPSHSPPPHPRSAWGTRRSARRFSGKWGIRRTTTPVWKPRESMLHAALYSRFSSETSDRQILQVSLANPFFSFSSESFPIGQKSHVFQSSAFFQRYGHVFDVITLLYSLLYWLLKGCLSAKWSFFGSISWVFLYDLMVLSFQVGPLEHPRPLRSVIRVLFLGSVRQSVFKSQLFTKTDTSSFSSQNPKFQNSSSSRLTNSSSTGLQAFNCPKQLSHAVLGLTYSAILGGWPARSFGLTALDD